MTPISPGWPLKIRRVKIVSGGLRVAGVTNGPFRLPWTYGWVGNEEAKYG